MLKVLIGNSKSIFSKISSTSFSESFETSFDHYDPISGKIAEEVIAAAKEFITVQNLEE